jgi:hypothetical protein
LSHDHFVRDLSVLKAADCHIHGEPKTDARRRVCRIEETSKPKHVRQGGFD